MSGKGGAVRGLFGAVGVNAVPVAGSLFGGWPPATTYAVYVVETLLLVALIALRLRLLAPERLETQGGRTQSRAEFIQGFVILCAGFSLAGAVFGAVILARSIDLGFTLAALASSMPVFLGIELLILLGDVVLQRRADQPQAEYWAMRGMRRIFVLFFAIWFGMGAMMFGVDFIWPFLALKLLMDVGIAVEGALVGMGVIPMPRGHITAEVSVKSRIGGR